jgi:tungstate transport system substrate-binding protein
MRRIALAAAVTAGLAVPSVATADEIRVQSTTDTVDAGLVEGLLRPLYKAAQPGDSLAYVGVGTGAALNNAKAGLADVVITHAPLLEQQFVNQGFSIGLGRQIFYSDYVIVGPLDDPAGVAAKHPHDAIGAFEDIAAAAEANPNAVRFQSRWDDSGTNVQEQLMWAQSNVTPKQTATKPNPPDPTRQEPGTGGTYPAWYLHVQRGQAANLTATENCVVAGNGCYTILDRGTFNRQVNAGTVTHLKIVSQKNTADARGGENLLINPFSVYLVNPAAIKTDPKPNVAAAQRFVDFLTSPTFQQALRSFPNAVDPAFLPNAAPNITLDGSLPQTVNKGATVTLSGRVSNNLPGAGAVSGMPVVLQQSTDDTTWINSNALVNTGPDGRFTVSAPVQSTVRFRLFTAAAPASGYNQFTPSALPLGVVTVNPTAPPADTTKDTTKPRVSKVKLSKTSLSLRISEKGSVRAIIDRRAGKKYRRVQTVTLRSTATGAKTVRVKHKRLSKGKYRVRLTATDAAGNKRTLTRNFTVR